MEDLKALQGNRGELPRPVGSASDIGVSGKSAKSDHQHKFHSIPDIFSKAVTPDPAISLANTSSSPLSLANCTITQNDSYPILSGSTFTAPVGGLYHCSFSGLFGLESASRVRMWFQDANGFVYNTTTWFPSTSLETDISFSDVIRLNKGETFEIRYRTLVGTQRFIGISCHCRLIGLI